MYCKRGYALVLTVSAASKCSVCKPSDILGNTRMSKELKELSPDKKKLQKGSIHYMTTYKLNVLNNINDQLDATITVLLLHLVGHLYYSPTLMIHVQTQIKKKCFESVFIIISHSIFQWINDPRLIKSQEFKLNY
jgi:hypothetical protein